ncbi:MAG: hypothetical protein K6C69_08265 [Lachnospiraceae bacterium]|nr:hypothetical protein [Lachnospiraceae bacterium]
MDKVIETLQSIEERADHYQTTTVNAEKDFLDRFKEMKRDYKLLATKATAESLASLRSSLQSSIDAELRSTKQSTEEAIVALNQNFTANHTKIAEDIFQRIIEV